MIYYFKKIVLFLSLLLLQSNCLAQQKLVVNLSMLEGLDITPDNILNFQVQSNLARSTNAHIKGTIVYRNSNLRLSYEFSSVLQPGINFIATNASSARYTYSSTALKELFEMYKKLPQGIFEYCVTVVADYKQTEVGVDEYSECLYQKSDDIFLINLVDPENDAKIFEFNPMLSWTVNYPFASSLTYRVKVAEIKNGQSAVSAIARNNPMFDDKNVMHTSLIYPVYAKPLQKNQPYAWTVDAYYKGILLGGAEAWKFTIIEDSLLVGVNKNPSYIDIAKESGAYSLYAPGVLKLKYVLEDLKVDSLQVELLDKNEKTIKLKEGAVLRADYGDNRFELSFMEHQPLKHLQPYTLILKSQTGREYRILFRYVNPELIK